MRTITIFALLFVGAFCTTIHQQMARDLFTQWKQNHNKLYASYAEEQLRFEIFSQNYLDILTFNAQDDSVTLALNHFADLTSAEFGALYTGYIPKPRTQAAVRTNNIQDLPESVDWRTKGAVTPVKNQVQCGSCWAFSSTGALEGLNVINGNDLVAFSEQQLVDCVTADQGCNGGYMSDAFAYTAEYGIETEADYPYTAEDGTCQYDASKAIKVNTGYQNVTAQSVDELKKAIVNQPVSVAIEADQLVFQFYAGGVIKKLCGDNLDHGVLAVGYGVFKGEEAFIVKNSWGGAWGNAGYVYISTDPTANKGNGVCGILADASFPTK